MENLITVIIWIICAFVCYRLAEKQGRNKLVAFIIGLLFSIIGVVGYLILGDKKVPHQTQQPQQAQQTQQTQQTQRTISSNNNKQNSNSAKSNS